MSGYGRWLVLGFAATGIAAPAWAEHAAARRIGHAIGQPLGHSVDDCDDACDEHSIDIDFGGLSIRGAALHSRRLSGRAALVRVEPRLDGLHVRVEGLDARISNPPPEAGQPAQATATGAEPDSARPTGLINVVNPLPGVPVHVSIDGTIALAGPHEIEMVAIDPRVEIGARGDVTTRLSGKLVRAGSLIATARNVTLQATGLTSPTWTVAAQVELQAAHPVDVAGSVDRAGASLYASADGGTLEAQIEWDERQRLQLRAHEMGLGFLPRVSGLSDEMGVDLAQARLSGDVELARTDAGVDARLEQVRVQGVVIEAAALSKEPLYMGEIGLDGRLAATPDQIAGALNLTHADAVAIFSGTVDRTGVDVGLALEPLPCQALLDSMPQGFLPTLEGMQLAGEIEASANVRFEFAALARARSNELAEDVEQAAPGEVALEFPFLERCEVVRDAPGIDLEALAGNYRHRFLTDGGSEQARILAAGADGFVTIAAAPDLARAFVILEDARFWHHDGFDREQIERAFWHNLGVEGFSRGASTITQQTARNLWLGHERTLGRKLQEALLTARLEQSLDKRRILEIYMNIIELGPEIHGVADAAHYHFDLAPHELNLLEALHIASLAPAPVTYSRRFDGGEVDARWRRHLEEQVDRLHVHRFMSRTGAEQAKQLPLRLRARGI